MERLRLRGDDGGDFGTHYTRRLLRASRALRAGVDPGLDQLAHPFLRPGGGAAAGGGVPTPRDQVVMRDVLVQEREIAAAVAGGVLYLLADLARGFSFPGHLDRRQSPARMAGEAFERRMSADRDRRVLLHVAAAAGVPRHAGAVVAANRRR